jgi:transposase
MNTGLCEWNVRHTSQEPHNVEKIHTNFKRKFLVCFKSVNEKHLIWHLPQPPYSPDFSPHDFLLFLKLKITLKRRRFQTVEDITTNATKDLKAISQISFEQLFQM